MPEPRSAGPEQRPPSVDALARRLAEQFDLPHPLLVEAARSAIATGDPTEAEAIARGLERALLSEVINATGVLLHTNLGRAPSAWEQPAAYSNLEFDVATGRRGSRHDHAGRLLARLCGAEAAIVVNNCASAVMLVLAAVAVDRFVVVSRGELVEIGGGFRIPEVMEQSGARLLEVGTTNRTRVADYAAVADRDDVAAILKVHPSNYRVEGFTESANLADLTGIGPPVIVDQGSGLVDERCPWLEGGPPAWLADEPGVVQAITAGAAAVTFSGDKLFGGPQAGIIVGSSDVVAACARHPLMRAVRPGGLVLAALQNTIMAYLRRDGEAIPFWSLATIPVDDLRARAVSLGVGKPTETAAMAGAGSLTGQELPSYGIVIDGDITAALREHTPPIVARVRDDQTFLDLRAVDPAHDEMLAAAVAASTT